MAGKEEGIRSSSATAMVEEEEEVCWRKQVDDNLKRLQSLLFGAELALENRDFSSAQLLGLRLIGFLDSHSHSDLDHAFIRPIRRQALSMLDSARRSLSPASDIKAFERAKQVPGCVFGSRGDIEIEKIKKSKYLQALLQQSNEVAVNGLGDKLEKEDKLNSKASKNMTQVNLTSMYRNNTTRANNGTSKSYLASGSNNSEECLIVERPLPFHNQNKGQSSFPFQRIEEDRAYGNSSGPKRLHMEINSPKTKSPLSDEDANTDNSGNGFVTAKAKMEMDARQRRGLSGSPSANVSPQSDINAASRGYNGRSYGVPRRGVRGNFIPPIRSNGGNTGNVTSRIAGKSDDALEDSTKRCLDMLCGPDGELPEKLRNLEPRLIEHVSNEIMDKDPNVRWNDIAGLEHAKKCVTEMVIWPLLRPDIFKGCRSPGKGLLLFGPPGTGKTMIGKAIAGEAKATFFYISASSLTSKWIGEGEKLVRALFGVASCRQPAVIFVDEIDSLLSQRKSEGEHESSRRLKTQFLIEMEGFDSGNEQILLIGATNRPQELDEAARRRLTKRLYIPLPSSEARAWIIQNLLEKDGLFKLAKEEIDKICNLTEGYSGSDMKNLVKDASMGPLREALKQGIEITTLKKEDMRPVTLQDFVYALQEVRPSVSLNELGTYEEWNRQFGSLSL
ncbi:ATPase family AAA domain-containing protein FIGL1 isoform X1 [Ziziphus jujuba]|uniref:ATPase family AAA domain-containing protein FIGL1 isoform X1 n=1 Tax=Ziziphus jujuba TaxID=326968 RepID=A0A6P4AES2_ZIZJJ|nr:ATPase family AAA domain-containing protein FIGL1 isoform X1 [Ziziphus jujuba]